MTMLIVDAVGEAVAYAGMLVLGGGAHREDRYGRPADRGNRPETIAKAP
jgi:hypothetical protein